MSDPKRRLMVPAAVLLGMWFVPDVLSSPPRFAFHLINVSNGLALVSLIATPVSACVILVLLVLPLSPRTLSAAVLPLGLAAAFLPLLGYFRLSLGSGAVSALAVVGLCSSVAVAHVTERKRLANLLLAFLPAGLLLTAVVGAVSGAASQAYLSAFKSPVSLYAAMVISAVSSGYLLAGGETRKTAE